MSEADKAHLFLQERQEEIIKMLKKEQKVLVPQLCEYFSVSSATIRSDLNALENKGLLVRTHGGAILNSKVGQEKNTVQKLEVNKKAKEEIAKCAAEFVSDGDIIAIDTGTTTLAFAREITKKKNLTVVTYDLDIAQLLENQSDASVVLIGGVIRKGFHCTVGPMAINAMQSLRIDKCFMATNGLTPELGISTPDLNHAEVKKQMMSISSQVFVLCDSSKIGYNSFCQVAEINRVDVLITDSRIEQKPLKALEEMELIVKISGR